MDRDEKEKTLPKRSEPEPPKPISDEPPVLPGDSNPGHPRPADR